MLPCVILIAMLAPIAPDRPVLDPPEVLSYNSLFNLITSREVICRLHGSSRKEVLNPNSHLRVPKVDRRTRQSHFRNTAILFQMAMSISGHLAGKSDRGDRGSPEQGFRGL